MPSRPSFPTALIFDVYEIPTGSPEVVRRLAEPCDDCAPDVVFSGQVGPLTRIVVGHADTCPATSGTRRQFTNRAARRHPRKN